MPKVDAFRPPARRPEPIGGGGVRSGDVPGTELSVLSSQCLDRRIPSKESLIGEAAAWEAARNKHHAKADWQFTTADARVKLKRLTRHYG